MPKDGTATRDRILDAAQKLMTEQGYSATSVDEVITESASSKGAFFHHFTSKSDLALRLTERYVAADLANLHGAVDAVRNIADPARRAIAFVRVFEEMGDEIMSEQSGCLYATVLAEREFTGTEINKLVADATLEWREELVAMLYPALKAHRLKLDAADLADHLYATFEGAFILARTLEDPTAMRAQLRVFRQLLEALFATPL